MTTRLLAPEIEGSASPPAVSEVSQARFYFDQTVMQLKLSQNAGPYQYMLADAAYWGFNAPGNNTFGTPFQAANAASELVGQWPAPKDGTLAGLTIRALNANFSAGGNCTLNVNGVASTLVAAYTNAGTTFADDTHLVQVVRGDLISIIVSAAVTNNPIFASVLLLPR
jgi:hypothetical protein